MFLRLSIFILVNSAIVGPAPHCQSQSLATENDSSSAASDQTPDDISAKLASLLKRHNVPGMVAVVMRDSRMVASGAVGVRRRGDTTPVTIHDRFHIGSETKPMTATLCAKLVRAGKLNWNTTLAQVFPELSERMLPPYREITLAQLLTHRSGICEAIDPADWKDLVAFEGTPTAARRSGRHE